MDMYFHSHLTQWFIYRLRHLPRPELALHIFLNLHLNRVSSPLGLSKSVCILGPFLSFLSASKSLVATTYNISLHNHEAPKPQRQLHLPDIHHYYSHSCLPFICQCFGVWGGGYNFFLLPSLSLCLFWTRLNWKGPLGMGVWGVLFPPTLPHSSKNPPKLPTLWLFSPYSPSPVMHFLSKHTGNIFLLYY